MYIAYFYNYNVIIDTYSTLTCLTPGPPILGQAMMNYHSINSRAENFNFKSNFSHSLRPNHNQNCNHTLTQTLLLNKDSRNFKVQERTVRKLIVRVFPKSWTLLVQELTVCELWVDGFPILFIGLSRIFE